MFLVVTPAYNEGDNAAGLCEALRASPWRPDRWVVVDDRSDDGTADAFGQHAGDLPLQIVPSGTTGGYMGSRYSDVVRAGLAQVDLSDVEHFGLLDCDIRFGPDYWSRLREHLASGEVGVASGVLASRGPDGVARIEGGQRVDLPRGGLRLVRGDTLRAVGGVERCWAPDSVMTIRARRAGWRTVLLPDVLAWSVRPTDSRGVDEAGWRSRGMRAWNVGQPGWQVAVRALAAVPRGRGSEGRALLAGYLEARGSLERLDDAAIQRYYRRERPREWARNLRARVTGEPSPHRNLPPRAVSEAELRGVPLR